MKPNYTTTAETAPESSGEKGFVWTPELLGNALADKQRKWSEAMNFKSELRDVKEESKKTYETLEAKLWLQVELSNPGMSDKKIEMRVKASDEFQIAWAEYITAKSKWNRCLDELETYEQEMETLRQISITVGVDLKYLNR